jgi:hypothetical protein
MLKTFGTTPAEKQVNDFDLRTLSKNFGDLVQTVFLDILPNTTRTDCGMMLSRNCR